MIGYNHCFPGKDSLRRPIIKFLNRNIKNAILKNMTLLKDLKIIKDDLTKTIQELLKAAVNKFGIKNISRKNYTKMMVKLSDLPIINP